MPTSLLEFGEIMANGLWFWDLRVLLRLGLWIVGLFFVLMVLMAYGDEILRLGFGLFDPLLDSELFMLLREP